MDIYQGRQRDYAEKAYADAIELGATNALNDMIGQGISGSASLGNACSLQQPTSGELETVLRVSEGQQDLLDVAIERLFLIIDRLSGKTDVEGGGVIPTPGNLSNCYLDVARRINERREKQHRRLAELVTRLDTLI